MNPYLFLILGWLLVLLEFYLPGAIMGTVGGVLIVTSIFLFAMQSSSFLAMLLFFVISLLGVVAVIWFALWQIKSTKNKNTIYSSKDQTGYVASSFDATAIGKTGVAITDLKPGGYILIEGKKYQAISVSGYITKGTEVTVISGQEESLIVKQSKKESSS